MSAEEEVLGRSWTAWRTCGELRPLRRLSLRRDAAVPRIGSAGKVWELQAVFEAAGRHRYRPAALRLDLSQGAYTHAGTRSSLALESRQPRCRSRPVIGQRCRRLPWLLHDPVRSRWPRVPSPGVSAGRFTRRSDSVHRQPQPKGPSSDPSRTASRRETRMSLLEVRNRHGWFDP